MKRVTKQISLLSEFKKFITASATGRRLMPSGKKIRRGTIQQYQYAYYLLENFEKQQGKILRVQILNRPNLQCIQKEKNYWAIFFRTFSSFLYDDKGYYDLYVSAVFKTIKAVFNYLAMEKMLPVGDFHKKFRVPQENFTPVILSPSQVRVLIINKEFEKSLPKSLQRTKDIFVFGCTVGLRHQDLMQLKKSNIQYAAEGVSVVLHTQKTGAEVRIPLPDYAITIMEKYQKEAGRYVLPRLAGSNLNLQVKTLMKKAGWDYCLPKIRHKRGLPVEIKTKYGKSYRFYDHITIHTMRRTAITTLLLMGVDEISVRRISGHAPGSREFFRYVIIVQDYLNAKVREAHLKLLKGEENLIGKIA